MGLENEKDRELQKTMYFKKNAWPVLCAHSTHLALEVITGFLMLLLWGAISLIFQCLL